MKQNDKNALHASCTSVLCEAGIIPPLPTHLLNQPTVHPRNGFFFFSTVERESFTFSFPRECCNHFQSLSSVGTLSFTIPVLLSWM